MIHIKTKKDIEGIKEASAILVQVLQELDASLEVGITTIELNGIAHEVITKSKAKPSFLGYRGYPASICTSVNEQVIHGLPNNYKICEGDVIGIDCGVLYNGYYTDAAITRAVGTVSKEQEELIRTTEECLALGIKAAEEGSHIRDISAAVYTHAMEKNFGVIKDYCGHGVGKALHEEPSIPNYRTGDGFSPRLQSGMVLAIEPMLCLGNGKIKVLSDDWTVVTRDNTIAAHFEHTIVIHENGVDILTSA